MLGNLERNVLAHVSLRGYLKPWRLTDTFIITNRFGISRCSYCVSSAAVLLTQSGSFGSGGSFQRWKVRGMRMSGWQRSGAGGGRAVAGPGPPARGDGQGQPPPEGSWSPCH